MKTVAHQPCRWIDKAGSEQLSWEDDLRENRETLDREVWLISYRHSSYWSENGGLSSLFRWHRDGGSPIICIVSCTHPKDEAPLPAIPSHMHLPATRKGEWDESVWFWDPGFGLWALGVGVRLSPTRHRLPDLPPRCFRWSILAMMCLLMNMRAPAWGDNRCVGEIGGPKRLVILPNHLLLRGRSFEALQHRPVPLRYCKPMRGISLK
ncbi:uncharacterized protein LY79DRAFT_534510 [Colletotrichum navitas]|uniref:Uncharacterized protein n=1 Tax=Colletotrichum navitas TaxID=681940 RepID=A0AAD8QE07_9PEZI|nr:uncharacterized protein LY79DRAFT_534510 [Colletotrichum navitas]KAK1600715.1 hypothetical protein LY79DRAFT_534510 [Colletotrichum navitas]